jgi:hypothetical protein
MDPHIKKQVQQLCRVIEEHSRNMSSQNKAAALYSCLRECEQVDRQVTIEMLIKTLADPAQPPCPCEECEAYRRARMPKAIQA